MRAAGERGSEVGIEMADAPPERDGGRGRRDLHHAELRAVRAVRRARPPDPGTPPGRGDGMTAFDRASRLALLPGLLRERILVLDGAMGTMLQAHRFTEADFRGERFRDHPRDLRGNNDLLCLTQPEAVAAVHAALPRGRRGHPQHELVHRDADRPGRLRLRPGDRPRAQRRGRAPGPRRRRRRRSGRARPAALRRRLARSDQPDRLDELGRRRSGRPQRHVGGARGRLPRIGRRPARGWRGHPAHRDDLRHAQREGGHRRGPVALRRDRRARAADHLGDDRRRLRTDAVGPDRRGVLAQHPPRRPADRRAQLRARSEAAARAPRRPVAGRRPADLRLPERRPARTSSAATTRRPRRWPRRSASGRGTASSTSPAAAAARRPSTSPPSPRRSPACRRARSPSRPARPASRASSR